jgi:hypothetical protein
MSLDDDELERIQIQAAMDQAGMGVQEEEVQEAIMEFFEACNDLAVTLHRHLPFDTIPGGLGGVFSGWLFHHYPDINERFDPDGYLG